MKNILVWVIGISALLWFLGSLSSMPPEAFVDSVLVGAAYMGLIGGVLTLLVVVVVPWD